MRLTPIPRCVLSEDVRVKVPVDGDYGGEYAEPEDLLCVRVETAQSLAMTGYALVDGCKCVVYIDAANSMGRREFPVGSLVEVDGQWLNAVDVAEYGVAGLTHLWLVQLA